MGEPVLFEIEGGIGTVTFNRPHALNAMDLDMARSLGALAGELPERADLRVLVLRGAGSAFMAGGDVQCFAGPRAEVITRLDELIDNFHAFVLALHKLPVPVIAAIQGAAAGAGFSLAIGCDIGLAAEDAKFVPAYRMLGTSPDGGGTFFLSQLAGPKRALDLLLAGKSVSAEQALQLNLINHIVPLAALDTEIASLAHVLSRNAAAAAAATKALVRRSTLENLRAHLEEEKQAFIACAETADFAEGVSAFLEKRSPRFARVPD